MMATDIDRDIDNLLVQYSFFFQLRESQIETFKRYARRGFILTDEEALRVLRDMIDGCSDASSHCAAMTAFRGYVLRAGSRFDGDARCEIMDRLRKEYKPDSDVSVADLSDQHWGWREVVLCALNIESEMDKETMSALCYGIFYEIASDYLTLEDLWAEHEHEMEDLAYQNMPKVIVAGGRDFDDYDYMCRSIDSLISGNKIVIPFKVISGMAAGADTLAIRYADDHKLPKILFPANWKAHPRRAGFLRNEDMLSVATHLIAFWDGRSHGTKHMIEIAKAKGIPVFVFEYGRTEEK